MRHPEQGSEGRPRLVFVTRYLPLPPRSGAPLRTHRLLTGLTETFDVTLVTYEHREASLHQPMRRADYEAALPGVRVVTAPGLGGGKRVRQLLSVPRSSSFEFGRYRSRAFTQAVAEAASGAALVHFDDNGAALAGPVPGPVNAFSPHNVEHRIIAMTAEAATGARRAFARREAVRVEREERRLWQAMDVCVAVSDLDAEAMRAGGAPDVLVVPNGTDPVERLPAPRRAAGEPLRVVFVGLGSYWPNAHGIAWLVRDVLPLVRRETDVVVDVVGEPPEDPVRADGVTYRGRVPELRPFYEAAHAVAVPLFLGSGTRLKVVEAMAMGRPVVSTSVGAEGLPVRPGEHWLKADEPEAFASALVEVGRRAADGDPALERMLAGARGAVEPLFWPAIAARLSERYLALAAPRSP